MRPSVGLDCDGILADFVQAVLDRVYVHTGMRIDPKTITTWEVFDSLPAAARAVCDEIYAEMKAPIGCASIPVYPGARAGVDALRRVADVFVVTSPFKGSATWAHEREEWLIRHFNFTYGEIIHAHDKRRVHCDMFVDDKPDHVRAWGEYWRARRGRGIGYLWTTPRLQVRGVGGVGRLPTVSSWLELQRRVECFEETW